MVEIIRMQDCSIDEGGNLYILVDQANATLETIEKLQKDLRVLRILKEFHNLGTSFKTIREMYNLFKQSGCC